MKPIFNPICIGLVSAVVTLAPWGVSQAAEANPAAVKTYLLKTLGVMKTASADYLKNAAAYQALIGKYQGDYVAAEKAEPDQIKTLVEAMRENYKAMDSFGYETIEGIVAGVSTLSDYDVYLDAGVPKKDASTDSPAAPVVLKLSDGSTIDQEGCLFTWIIEPMLWGGNPKWCVSMDLNGDGKIGARESLPKATVLMASAIDVDKKIGELVTTSESWKPSVKDCFDAIIAMTPTLSGYFDDWKESRYSQNSSGLFTAVSRVSDMKGIMSSVQILYTAVNPLVEEKDKALARSINAGFENILQFVDRVGTREKERGSELTVSEIDEMAHQATEKSDKLVPQVEQAAALLDVKSAS